MFVVLCALTLAGCGAAKIDSPANARAEYQKSVDDEYRACINDNLKNVEKCQAKRALLEINERPSDNVATEKRGNTAGTAQRTTTATGSTQAASAVNATQITSSLPARIPPTPPEVADPEPRDTRSTPSPTPF
jgi:hypothetical protein